MPEGVSISLEDMYRLLVKVDAMVTTLTASVGNTSTTVADHEQRLRELESTRIEEARLTAMEEDVKAIRADLESMKRKVYAIPSASAAVAVATLVIVLIRWL